MQKINDSLFLSSHDEKNNKVIFDILKKQDKEFYSHTNIEKPNNVEDIDNYFFERKTFDIFYNNQIVGVVEISESGYLNYWIAIEFQNLGIMSKILSGINKELLDYKYDRIYIHIQKDNTPSIRVAEKAGFKLKEKQIFENDDIMLLFEKRLS